MSLRHPVPWWVMFQHTFIHVTWLIPMFAWVCESGQLSVMSWQYCELTRHIYIYICICMVSWRDIYVYVFVLWLDETYMYIYLYCELTRHTVMSWQYCELTRQIYITYLYLYCELTRHICICICMVSWRDIYVQPILLGVTFSNAVSKLKAQSSNVSLHWNVAKETYELWALSFRKCHPKWDWLYIYLYCELTRHRCICICIVSWRNIL